ncbi:MAG: MBL fold metallo-hydrolase, partial [Rhodobacteraceae bacterium]|nr:MBL fold metallo-hydrolase [Paracoccaceae bacterium]
GPTEVMLVDAEFQKNDAQTLVGMIKATGKKLTTIYISYADPDAYFGLDVITAAFPEAKVLATPTTVADIKASVEGKLGYWGPILGENAPEKTIVPEVFEGDKLAVDGEEIRITGLDGHDPRHTFLWVPSVKTVLGGVLVEENEHLWIADRQTPASRQDWLKTLDQIAALEPARVIPSHFSGKSTETMDSVNFTRAYLLAFEEEAAKAADSTALIGAMKARYPELEGGSQSLEIGAKVVKGEMKWP